MRPMFFCLDGDLAGRTLCSDAEELVIGSGADCDLVIPSRSSFPVDGHHARIRRRGEAFEVAPVDGSRVSVNGQRLMGGMELREGDLLRLGEGPSFRFRITAKSERPSKSLRQMMSDSASFSRRGPGRTTQIRQFAGQFVHEAVSHSTRPFKALVLVLGLALVGVSFLLYRSNQEQRRREDDLSRQIRQSAEDVDREHSRLREDLESERAERKHLQDALESLGRDKERSEASLARVLELNAQMQSLIQAEGAAREIHDRYAKGIPFILVGCYFYNPETKQVVRHRMSASGERLRRNGSFALGVSGDGPKYVEWTSGSGFLVSSEGHIVSNRHVVDPWWESEDYGDGIMNSGFRPVRHVLAVAFPGSPRLHPVTRCGVSSAADVGLMKLRVLPEGLPVLPLAARDYRARTGQKSILAGYPLGYEGLNIKLEKRISDQLRDRKPEDVDRAVELIAELGGITVTMTQGIIGSVTPEQLVYDAVTTFGGSGGPLFDTELEVIGINAAISRFAGANLGVPIGFARDLLEDGTATRVDVVEAPEFPAGEVRLQ